MRIKALAAIALAAMVINATGCAQTGDSSKTEAGQSSQSRQLKKIILLEMFKIQVKKIKY